MMMEGRIEETVYILFMSDSGHVNSFQKISDTQGNFTATLNNADFFGISVAGIGDLNGDGVEDLAVGTKNDDDGGTDKGCVYILFLNTDGTVASHQKISDTAGDFSGAITSQGYFGRDVGRAGDLNNDNVVDLFVGNEYDDDGGTNRGAVWVLFLTKEGKVDTFQKISDTEGNFSGTLDNGDAFGSSVDGIGDVDGDGVSDMVCGTWNDDDGGTNRGAVYVLLLNANGTVKSHQKISNEIDGRSVVLQNDYRFGYDVSFAGDIDRDGISDIVVGAYYAESDHTGYFYLVCLNADGSAKSYRRFGEGFGWDYDGLGTNSYFGRGAAYLGDLNDDGYEDFSFGLNLSSTNNGIAILFMDSTSFEVDNPGIIMDWKKVSELHGGFDQTLDVNDEFGSSVAQVGDLNGDGIPELIVGAPNDDDGGADRGAVYILFMNEDATVNSAQKISDTQGSFSGTLDNTDHFGFAVAGIGDVDGDGFFDVAVGAIGDDDGGADVGAVWLLMLDSLGQVNNSQKISATAGGFGGTLAAGDGFGSSVAGIGDLDGDGELDIAVGANFDDDGGSDRGAFGSCF